MFVTLAADKGYRADWVDGYLLELGITPVIPSKTNENRDARPVAFDRELYRDRNIIERLIGWLKECRRIFSRFEKTARNFAAMITMAFIERYLKLLAQPFQTRPNTTTLCLSPMTGSQVRQLDSDRVQFADRALAMATGGFGVAVLRCRQLRADRFGVAA